jgi:hypothetical protein
MIFVPHRTVVAAYPDKEKLGEICKACYDALIAIPNEFGFLATEGNCVYDNKEFHFFELNLEQLCEQMDEEDPEMDLEWDKLEYLIIAEDDFQKEMEEMESASLFESITWNFTKH